jgi:hypothetical protein
LFSGYVDTLLKIKQESTGWPERLKTDADKEAFLADYEKKEGIKLDPTNIASNPGKRTLAKLMLNRFVHALILILILSDIINHV